MLFCFLMVAWPLDKRVKRGAILLGAGDLLEGFHRNISACFQFLPCASSGLALHIWESFSRVWEQTKECALQIETELALILYL